MAQDSEAVGIVLVQYTNTRDPLWLLPASTVPNNNDTTK